MFMSLTLTVHTGHSSFIIESQFQKKKKLSDKTEEQQLGGKFKSSENERAKSNATRSTSVAATSDNRSRTFRFWAVETAQTYARQ